MIRGRARRAPLPGRPRRRSHRIAGCGFRPPSADFLAGSRSWPAAAATLAVFWNVLVRGEVFAARDHAAFYWPVKSIYSALARSSAGLPLWNPFLASGQPFAANPEHAVFHPLTALFLLLPFESAFVLQVVLPFLVSAGSGLFLARALRLSGAAAALSAVAWGYGGATLSTLHLVPTLLTIAPLPAVLGFAVRLGSRSVPRGRPRVRRARTV